MGVACGVQILEKENASGQKIIDDGVSTVAALKKCRDWWEADPDATPQGEVWSESMVQVFRAGLQCRVVAYADSDDLEARSAWNTAKHDEESNTVRWSTLHQKLNTAAARFKKLGDWSTVGSSFLELYSPSKKATVGRWVRAARASARRFCSSSRICPT